MRTARNSTFQYKTTKNENSGFTLIELLIVIVILAILSILVINLLDVDEYRKQARDARRLHDILILQSSILGALANSDIALTDTSNCVTCSSYNGTTDTTGSGWVIFTNLSDNGLKNMASSLPVDPLNNETYNFSYYSDGKGFELNTILESKKYKTNAVKDGGNNDNIYERGIDLEIE